MNYDIEKAESPEIENAVLSVILKQDTGSWIDEFLKLGGNDDMFTHGRATLYRMIKKCLKERGTIELITLTDFLVKKGHIDSVGGPKSVADAYTYCPSTAHFTTHVSELRKLSIKRRALKLGVQIENSINENSDTILEIVRDGLDDMEYVEVKESSKDDLVSKAVLKLRNLIEGAEPEGFKFGFDQVEKMGGRLKGKQLVLLGARPSVGKTSFMMNMIEAACIENNTPCRVFSLEMSEDQLTEKYLYGSSGISYQDIANRELEGGRRPIEKRLLEKMLVNSKKFTAAPLKINDKTGIHIDELCSIIRSDAKEGVKMFFIDYLQLVTCDGSIPREQQVSKISSRLKGIAKDLDITVVALVQINRESASRSTGLPKMSDIRESGSLEQDADVILLLHRFAYMAETEEERQKAGDRALCIVAKSREASTGAVEMRFASNITKFVEV